MVLVFLGGFFFVVVILQYDVGVVVQMVYVVVCFGYYVGMKCWIVVWLYVVVEYEVLLYQQVQFVGDVEECVVFVVVVVLVVQYVYVGVVCGCQYLVQVCGIDVCGKGVEWNDVGVFGEDFYVVDDEGKVLFVFVVFFVVQFDCVQFDVLFVCQFWCVILVQVGLYCVVVLCVVVDWLLVSWIGQFNWNFDVVLVGFQQYCVLYLGYGVVLWILYIYIYYG